MLFPCLLKAMIARLYLLAPLPENQVSLTKVNPPPQGSTTLEVFWSPNVRLSEVHFIHYLV